MLSGLITRSLSILSGTSLVSLWFVSPAGGTLLWTASALSHDPPTSRFSSRETGERKLSKVRVFTLPCFLISPQPLVYGFPWWLNSKESACNAGDAGSVPGLRRSPRKGNGKPLQYSCLGPPLDRGAWQATVHVVVKELDVTKATKNETETTS